MSYTFYKILHLSALFLGALALGGLWLFYTNKDHNNKDFYRKFLLNLHGISFFLVFVAGFGLIAKLQIPSPWPYWLYVKLLLWLLLGASPFFLKKGLVSPKEKAKALLLFGGLAAALIFSVLVAILK